MKKVLCFGDSNTYGFIPESRRRYDKDTRWTGVLSKLAEGRFEITEAGCNNRTAFQDNPYGVEVTGYKILPEYLNEKFDIVILALGLNDVQKIYNTEISDIEAGIDKLVKLVKELSPSSKIILVSPALISEAVLYNEFFSKFFDKNSVEKALHYPDIYEKISKENDCIFIDWNKFVKVSPIDGLHLSGEAHERIANEFYYCFKKLYMI